MNMVYILYAGNVKLHVLSVLKKVRLVCVPIVKCLSLYMILLLCLYSKILKTI
jgi:hypothetical protein